MTIQNNAYLLQVPNLVLIQITHHFMRIQGPLGFMIVPLASLTKSLSQVKFLYNNHQLLISYSNETSMILDNSIKDEIQEHILSVIEGFSLKLKIEGIGNRVLRESKRQLKFSLGNSYAIPYRIPSVIRVDILTPNLIEVKGIVREEVTQVVAQLKKLKKTSPYHLKGIYESTEQVKLKPTKKK